MSKEMNFGVDMVYISSPEFRVQNLDGWSIKSGNKVGQESEPFGISKEGQILEGTGYYQNRSKEGTLNASWNLSKKGCLVQFNPSTLLHDYELTANLEHVVPMLQSDMKLLGVDIDLKGSRLARLDLTGQRILETPCSTFSPALSALTGKRMKGTKYPDGYEFSNKSRGVVFYDKSLQLEQVKKVKGVPRNILRCEARWQKNRVIGHAGTGVGVSSLEDLIQTPQEGLKSKFQGFLSRDVFQTAEGSQLAFSFKNELHVFKEFSKLGRGAWKEYFLMHGLENVLDKFESFDAIEQLFLCSGFSMKQAGRNVKQLRDIMGKKSFIDSSRGENTIAQSINTLREAFTA